MHARALQSVLLVRAIEESDRTGDLLPLADREEATRTAARAAPDMRDSLTATTLTRPAERFLATRAGILRERLLLRSPILANVLSLASGSSRIARVLLLVAFIVGISMSALDGSRRINLLAFPLIGLIAWNLLVYFALFIDRLRPRTPPSAGTSQEEGAPRVAHLYERWVRWRTEGLLRRSSLFNAPLAAALRRFTTDWVAIGHPILVLRAKRLLHLSAALVALGLIAGLYVRGIVLRYEAGWESTFLSASTARVLVNSLYAPASSVTGIALPGSEEQMRALEWTATGGGVNAAMWIHLIAATAILFVVIPRLLAAVATTLGLWRATRRPVVPVSIVKYARGLLSGAGVVAPQEIRVAPYAFQPAADAIEGLRKIMETTNEGRVEIELREALKYGEEDEVPDWLAQEDPKAANLHVVLFTLSATPEAENHGKVVGAFRDWARGTPVLVIVDESDYVARIVGDSSLQSRLDDRRDLWIDFVKRFGVDVRIENLRRPGTPR